MGYVEDSDKYISEWTKTQVFIWKEKIEQMRIIDTGALHESFLYGISESGPGRAISFRFRRHGIFQELGTGNGFRRGNGGDLEILDPVYRREHGLDKPRSAGPVGHRYMSSGNPRGRRQWMSKKLYMSVRALLEDLPRIMAEDTVAVICDCLDDSRRALK